MKTMRKAVRPNASPVSIFAVKVFVKTASYPTSRKNSQSAIKEKNSRAPARRMNTATAAAMSAAFFETFLCIMPTP